MHKILVIDDDPTLVDFLKLLLEAEGYEVEDATDGDAALLKMEQLNPEIVLLDYKLPGKDGLDVLREVLRRHPDSVVVMLTGKGNEETAVECMKAGAVDYVIKPFENERLLSVIKNAMKRHELKMRQQTASRELREILIRTSILLEKARSTPDADLQELTSLLHQAINKLDH